MSNETLTSNIAGLVLDIQAEAIFKFNQHAGILTAINWVDTEGTPGKTVDFPIYGAVTSSDVSQVSEGSDHSTNKQITNTATTATLEEHVIMANISDLSVMSANRNLVDDISTMFADAMLAKVEDDVVGLFTAFDSTTVSGLESGNALTLDLWFGAIAALKSAGANVRDLVAVLSPKQYWGAKGLRSILEDGSNAGSNVLSEQFLQAGFVDVVTGIPVLVSNEIAETTSAPGAMYEKTRALGLHSKGFMNIEVERNASLRSFELVAVGRWKEVELTDVFGVEIVTDIS